MNGDREKLAQAYRRAKASGVDEMTARRMALESVNTPEPSALSPAGLGRSALQGATFGFGDEIVAGVRALSRNQTYDEALADERMQVARYREAHPVVSLGAEMVGGVGSGLGAGAGLARAVPSVGRALAARGGMAGAARLVGTGAAAGAVTGAGTAEGTGMDKLRATVPGALAGATFAGVLGAAAAPASKLGSVALDVLPFGRTKVARAIPGAEDVEERARGMIVRAMERDKVTPADLRARAVRAGDAPVTVMDLGATTYAPNANLHTLGSSAAVIPGEGKTAMTGELMERMEGQGRRLVGAARRGLNVGNDDAAETAATIARRRYNDAKPLYEKALPIGIKDPELNELLDLPEFEKAYDVARRIAKIEDDVDLPPLFREVGNRREASTLTVEAIDRTKKVLDRLTMGKLDADYSIDREMARALRSRLGRALDRVDELVPEYKAARQVWKGESDNLAALDFGKGEALDADPSILRRIMAGRERLPDGGLVTSDSQKQMIRLGALDELRRRFGKVTDTNDVASRFFGKSNVRDVFESLFESPDEFNAFMDNVRAERAISYTRNKVLRGSDTTEKALGVADAGMDVLTDMAQPKVGAARMALRGVANRLRGQSEATMAKVAPKLLSGTRSRNDLLDFLEEIEGYINRRAQARIRSSGALAGTTGVVVS